MEALAPIHTADLFEPLHTELIRLLRALRDEDWGRPTMAGAWRVRDVAAHLLDIDLRKLAGGRDRHRWPPANVSSYDEVVGLINTINASGVAFGERLSPRVLGDLLEVTGRWVSDFVLTLPPDGEAWYSVLWAGETRSTEWMDIGREYTERWHHQMQIREAVGAAPLLERRWLQPLLELSVRAFYRAYEPVPAADGTAIVFAVDGEPDYVWSIVREAARWSVLRGRAPDAAATLRTDPDTAWRLLYNALPPAEARARVVLSGDEALTAPILHTRSVMV